MKNRTLARIALVLCLTLGSVAFSASQAKAQSQGYYAYSAAANYTDAYNYCNDALSLATKASVRSYLTQAMSDYSNAINAMDEAGFMASFGDVSAASYFASLAISYGQAAGVQTANAYYATGSGTVRGYMNDAADASDDAWVDAYDCYAYP